MAAELQQTRAVSTFQRYIKKKSGDAGVAASLLPTGNKSRLNNPSRTPLSVFPEHSRNTQNDVPGLRGPIAIKGTGHGLISRREQ